MSFSPAVAWVLAFASAAAAGRAGDGDVHYAQSSLEPEGELLDVELLDLDGDGHLEVCLALRPPTGERELRFHRLRPAGVEARPFRTVPVLDEALAWGVAEVRAEAGRELVFLTASGAWSFSLEHEGYRGNVQRLVAEDLVYDVPDPRELFRWEYVLPRPGGDWILLPALDGYAVWGPPARQSGAEEGGPEESGAYEPLARFPPRDLGSLSARRGGAEEDETEVRLGGGGLRIDRVSGDGSPFLMDGDDRSPFLTSRRGYRAPALVDVDGDGALDLLELTETELVVRLGGGATPAEKPSWAEPLPAYLDREAVRLSFVDLEGDGDSDLIVQCSDEVDGMDPVEVSLLVLVNDGRRLLPERPTQVLRFEASFLVTEPADVDGDGRADLAIRKFELPSLTGAITGLEFHLTQLVFLGEEGARPFARKPALKDTRTYDETTVLEAVANRDVTLDFDGDGIADMVELDVEGRVSIRRLVRESSFFGGESWHLEETPWLRFEAFGEIQSLEVHDLNGDGLGDVISRGPKSVSLLLSQGSRGGRR